jgi:hypothetical protein
VSDGCQAFVYAPAYERDGPGVPPSWKLQVDAMWAALETGIPTVNGYSGTFPRGYGELWDNRAFAGAARSRIQDALQKWIAFYRLDPGRVCLIDSP